MKTTLIDNMKTQNTPVRWWAFSVSHTTRRFRPEILVPPAAPRRDFASVPADRRTTWAVVITAILLGVMTVMARETNNSEVKLAVDLSDGSHVVGLPGLKAISFQTSYAKLDIPLAEVSAVTVAPDHETASVVMQNGDILKGILTTGSIDLECAFGKIAISAHHIKKIQVVRIGKGLSESLLKGMVLRLAFDADEGQKAVDSSPAGNNGIVHGPPG